MQVRRLEDILQATTATQRMRAMSLGFYLHANTKPAATELCLRSVRRHHPDSPILLACDAGPDYSALSSDIGASYRHYDDRIGPMDPQHGWEKWQLFTWMERLRDAVECLGTTHFMMLEDDVHILKPVTVETDWECVGTVRQCEGQVPTMPDAFLDIIEGFCGVRPEKNYYMTPGGSIFSSSTLLQNYDRVMLFLTENYDRIHRDIYFTISWLDCMMTVFYFLCGKPLIESPRLHNLWEPTDLSTLPQHVEIVHNYKELY